MKKKVLGLIDGQSGNIGSIKKAIKDLINEKPYQLKIIQGNFNPNNFDKIILHGCKSNKTFNKLLNAQIKDTV